MKEVTTQDMIAKEAIYSVRTEQRRIAFYEKVFGLDIDKIKRKEFRILDIGTGDSNFPQKAFEAGTSQVIAYDASYHRIKPDFKKNAVSGYAQQLPFVDNAFNLVTACWSFRWVKTDLMQALTEAMRVVSPEGMVAIHPVYPLPGVIREEISPNTHVWKPKESIDYSLAFKKPKNFRKVDMQEEASIWLQSLVYREEALRPQIMYW